jgi:hypothetical protein
MTEPWARAAPNSASQVTHINNGCVPFLPFLLFPCPVFSRCPTGHLECLRLHRVCGFGVARRDYFIRSPILPVRLHVTVSSIGHARSLIGALRPQLRATYCTASFDHRPLRHLPSRIRAWSTAPWSPTPIRIRWRCDRAKRPLGADICGTRVSDFLEPPRASGNSFSYKIAP